jgi:hypothetical protein
MNETKSLILSHTSNRPESRTLAVPELGQYLACSGLLRLAQTANAYSSLHSHKLRLLNHSSVLIPCMLRFESGYGLWGGQFPLRVYCVPMLTIRPSKSEKVKNFTLPPIVCLYCKKITDPDDCKKVQ